MKCFNQFEKIEKESKNLILSKKANISNFEREPVYEQVIDSQNEPTDLTISTDDKKLMVI